MNPNTAPPSGIVYPESDGLPMSDNTLQFEWIIKLATNLATLFRDREDVFVKGNQFWYPVEGEPTIVASPDVYVVFGRPKGYRPSYRQWEEDGIPMTVVFEVLSPSNTHQEMVAKFDFYETHGVEEYYVLDPDANSMQGFQRQGDTLLRIRPIHEHTSSRLGILFDLSEEEIVVRHPDGRPFLAPEDREREFENQERSLQEEIAEAERGREEAERGRDQAERQRDQAERGREEAERERDQTQQRANRLTELSRRALRQQATPEELEELERLLGEPNEG